MKKAPAVVFTFWILALFGIGAASAALLCEIDTCSSWVGTEWVNFSKTYGCTNTRGIGSFEVWGACGPNVGAGYNHNPIIQTPSGIQLATSQAGTHCYCRLKSVNGGSDLPSSSLWLYTGNTAYTTTAKCAANCSPHCAHSAQNILGFRLALFLAAGY